MCWRPAPIAILLLSLSVVACAAPVPRRADAETAIYGAVLDSLYRGRAVTQYLLAPEPADPLGWLSHMHELNRVGTHPEVDTNRTAMARAARRTLSDVDSVLADDFVRANTSLTPVRPLVHAARPIVWDTLPPLAPDVRDSLRFIGRVGAGFERYHRAYPGVTARITFSRIGLSANGQQALVYVESWCGTLCAGGMLITLEQREGRWLITQQQGLWAS